MNGYERFMTALRREQPDRVPIWELIVNKPVVEGLYGPGLDYHDFVEREDLDGLTIFEDGRIVDRIDSTTYRDEWGITWRVEDVDVPYPLDGPIKSEADLDRYVPPDPDADHRLVTLEKALRRFKGEKAIVFLSHDGFEFPHYLRGMDNLLLDYIDNAECAHRLARIAVDYKKRVMDRALEMGADVALTGDDYAHRHSLIMSPMQFREYIKPYLKEMVDVAKKHSVPFIKHTDGDIWAIMDDLVEIGCDAVDPLEPIANMDIGEAKRRYGDRLALLGNVDCGELLSRGTPEQVEEAVKETIAKGSVGGGHVLASSNSIHPAVDPANYRAMVEAGRRHGVYPLDEEMIEQYAGRNYIAPQLD